MHLQRAVVGLVTSYLSLSFAMPQPTTPKSDHAQSELSARQDSGPIVIVPQGQNPACVPQGNACGASDVGSHVCACGNKDIVRPPFSLFSNDVVRR